MSGTANRQIAMIVATTGFAVLSLIDAPYPFEQRLQHVPTIAMLMGLAVSTRWFRLSDFSFGCLIAFIALHIIGARWIYSNVPYDRWSELFCGISMSEYFGWQRNHYDRLVHFASGSLIVPPVAECLRRWCGMSNLIAATMAVATILAFGTIYEIFEWQVAMTFSPAQAESYNGQQGDIWDPQKDLALAWLGGTLSAAIVIRHGVSNR